ncbi:DNA gyrase subunit A [Limibacillus halophilus]
MSEDTPTPSDSDILPVTIEDEMKRSYLDYAMSVIVARALPDVRDGLKPVHRRILYGMKEGGYDWNRAYRKSARIVGDVMGQYHPHGDSAIYDAMVRMAQPWSMRQMLVDGQGNFGSIDGDPPAAMRYTEARLQRLASEALLEDMDKDTVDFVPNYDESTTEPSVLPARYPNLLVNGAGGIAVGMATNIPTHNLGEVIDACNAYLDDPEISVDSLMEYVPGPDFPTGGIIMGKQGCRDAMHSGRGSVVIRGRAEVEERGKDRESIVITEIPYQVNKARMIEQIANAVRAGTIEGVAELRDESDRRGLRVVVDLKRDAMGDVVLNQLYRFTSLQTSFGVNMLALNGGRPELLGLKDIIVAFIDFREEVITRRTIYELRKAREKAHIQLGLAVAVANIDAIIELIRRSPDPETARNQLMERGWPADEVMPLIALVDEPGSVLDESGHYHLSEAQARAILDLRLQKLTGLEREKIADELQGLIEQIKEYLAILDSRERLQEVLRDELREIRERYAEPRRTTIDETGFEQDDESLIQRQEMVMTITHGGYIKRVPLSTYRAQRRGGKGRSGMATREDDFVTQVFVCSTHTPVLFFTSRGMAYKMKVWRLPQGTPQARGKALVNLLPLEQGEYVTTCLPLPEDEKLWEDMFVMFATSTGTVRRNSLSDFTNIKANGKIAMKLDEAGGGHLVSVQLCHDNQDVLLATALGKAIRFQVTDVRVFAGRNSVGVRGIQLGKGDEIISMSILTHKEVDTELRDAYLRYAAAKRRALGLEEDEGETAEAPETALTDEQVTEMEATEQFILSVAADGLGKRTSAYEYRLTKRGGQGIGNLDLSRGKKRTKVVAAFPVEANDQLMLVTDGGKLIRMPVEGIRIAGRTTRGVMLFRIDDTEKVVSVAWMGETEEEEEEGLEEIVGEDTPGGETPSGAEQEDENEETPASDNEQED